MTMLTTFLSNSLKPWNYYIRWIVKRATPSTRQHSASVVIRFELSHALCPDMLSSVICVKTFWTYCHQCQNFLHALWPMFNRVSWTLERRRRTWWLARSVAWSLMNYWKCQHWKNQFQGRGILILPYFRNPYYAYSQVLLFGSLVSELFLFLLDDLSFPCGYFFSASMGISMGKWPKAIKWPKITFTGSKMVTKVYKWGF